jgi:hypothetical protein
MIIPDKSVPMYFPPAPFNLADAVMCSALVNTAYDMYNQWHEQGSPSDPSQFSWTPKWPPFELQRTNVGCRHHDRPFLP